MKRALTFLVCLCAAAAAPLAAAGTFKTITIDGDYSDWASVPAVDDDSGDNSGGPDIGVTKVANDANYLYIYNSFPNSLSLGTFLTIDVDENVATGFDVFGLGLVGSEVGWQNDFPFTQGTGVFNDGQGMTGDFFGSGAALLDSFANGPARELAISLDIIRNQTGTPAFPDDTVRMLFWTDLGLGADGIPSGLPNDSGLNGDVSAVISYQLATPEPGAAALLLLGLSAVAVNRRR
ncbi:MAG: PEP-CTERM sorting domain-containing protein [Planctomycetales bacterium]|nr:PEP-CTERM sorting domain-containing protein [Planctomycetales bacterium]